MPPKAKVSKNAASVNKPKPNPTKSRKLKGGAYSLRQLYDIVVSVCKFYDQNEKHAESTIDNPEYASLLTQNMNYVHAFPTNKRIIDFFFKNKDKSTLNRVIDYNSSELQPFVMQNHVGILYKSKMPNSDNNYALVIKNDSGSKLRCFKILKPIPVTLREQGLKLLGMDNRYDFSELPLYYAYPKTELGISPAGDIAPSRQSYSFPPPPYEEDNEDNDVHPFKDEPDEKYQWQKPDLPKKPEEEHHPFGAPSQSGGKKKIVPKKTKAKYIYNKREYTLYEGARGGKYIRLDKEFVSIKKLKTKAQAH